MRTFPFEYIIEEWRNKFNGVMAACPGQQRIVMVEDVAQNDRTIYGRSWAQDRTYEATRWDPAQLDFSVKPPVGWLSNFHSNLVYKAVMGPIRTYREGFIPDKLSIRRTQIPASVASKKTKYSLDFSGRNLAKLLFGQPEYIPFDQAIRSLAKRKCCSLATSPQLALCKDSRGNIILEHISAGPVGAMVGDRAHIIEHAMPKSIVPCEVKYEEDARTIVRLLREGEPAARSRPEA